MSIPLVSICCLAYNHELFIRQCLDGFIMQHGVEFEVLIHDDASNDETSNIIKEYEKKYPNIIKPIYQTENQYSKGVKPTFHFNIPRAKGKYIALCEGDDYWTDPYKLQKQVDFLEANPEFVVCSHNAKIVDSNNHLIKKHKVSIFEDRIYTEDDLKNGAFLLTLTMCFRNVIRDFPKEMKKVHNADTFLISLLGNYGKGMFLSNIKPAVYRLHNNNVWGNLDDHVKIKHHINTFKHIKIFYKRKNDIQMVNYSRDYIKYKSKELMWLSVDNKSFRLYIYSLFEYVKNSYSTIDLKDIKSIIKSCFLLIRSIISLKEINE